VIVTGKTPFVSNLAVGVYDVSLTVTDNSGISTTDFIMLSVASSNINIKGDTNQNGTLGLEDIIMDLQILTGIK